MDSLIREYKDIGIRVLWLWLSFAEWSYQKQQANKTRLQLQAKEMYDSTTIFIYLPWKITIMNWYLACLFVVELNNVTNSTKCIYYSIFQFPTVPMSTNCTKSFNRYNSRAAFIMRTTALQTSDRVLQGFVASEEVYPYCKEVVYVLKTSCPPRFRTGGVPKPFPDTRTQKKKD